MSEEKRRVLAQNPINQNFLDMGTTEENDCFVYTFASIPAYDFQVFGFILRKLLYHELVGRRVVHVFYPAGTAQAGSISLAVMKKDGSRAARSLSRTSRGSSCIRASGPRSDNVGVTGEASAWVLRGYPFSGDQRQYPRHEPTAQVRLAHRAIADPDTAASLSFWGEGIRMILMSKTAYLYAGNCKYGLNKLVVEIWMRYHLV